MYLKLLQKQKDPSSRIEPVFVFSMDLDASLGNKRWANL